MRKFFTLFILILISSFMTYASFPVETSQEIITIVNNEPSFDWLGFLFGVLSMFLLPWSLLVMPFLFTKNFDRVFRKSFGIGALVGLVLALLFAILLILAFGGAMLEIFTQMFGG